MRHQVKIFMEYYAHIQEGKKRFEVRKNDRDYQVGDELLLREVRRDNGYDKLDSARYLITYVHHGYGMQEDFVVLE
jgi:ASC-1-like (ASCH) protein